MIHRHMWVDLQESTLYNIKVNQKSMIELISSLLILTAQQEYSERVNKTCSYLVGIPYASDNFSDEEWERFKICRDLIKNDANV